MPNTVRMISSCVHVSLDWSPSYAYWYWYMTNEINFNFCFIFNMSIVRIYWEWTIHKWILRTDIVVIVSICLAFFLLLVQLYNIRSIHQITIPCIADIVSLPLILSPLYSSIYVSLKKINLSFGSNCIATPYCIFLFKNIITWYLLRYCRLGLTQSKHAHYSVQNCEHWTHLPLLSSIHTYTYCIQLVCSKLQTFFIPFAKRLRCNDNNRNAKCIHYIYSLAA